MTPKISQETVYKTLTETPKSASQIAKELGVARSTPKRHLEVLAQAGRAKKLDDGWIKFDYITKNIILQASHKSMIESFLDFEGYGDEFLDEIHPDFLRPRIIPGNVKSQKYL